MYVRTSFNKKQQQINKTFIIIKNFINNYYYYQLDKISTHHFISLRKRGRIIKGSEKKILN